MLVQPHEPKNQTMPVVRHRGIGGPTMHMKIWSATTLYVAQVWSKGPSFKGLFKLISHPGFSSLDLGNLRRAKERLAVHAVQRGW